MGYSRPGKVPGHLQLSLQTSKWLVQLLKSRGKRLLDGDVLCHITGALIVYDVSEKSTFKDIWPGENSCQWLSALKQNSDPALLAAVMLVGNKVDKLNERSVVQKEIVKEDKVLKALYETVFKDPKQGLGWLYEASSKEVNPFRIANSMMYARTSARDNTAELYELTEKAVPSQGLTIQGLSVQGLPELLKQEPGKLEYEPTVEVKTISQALEALLKRIYARSKDMEAGGSKPSGKAFRLQATTTTEGGSCC
ncbi:unnamed protein product [Phytophthora fragariaefolia]|uniref:Unnamed protein product n=1 Tax=Phytophthora fragariaefolia TaxID=1490495 RepID=A0A9W7D134_9STRA|nr:unnamed protein product [Phytophthora fragariaefolia]